MDTAYGGSIRKSIQIGQRWRQDHDWLCLSYLAISDCKLLGRAKSDFHAFSNDAQRALLGLNPRTLSTRINTLSHFFPKFFVLRRQFCRENFSPVSAFSQGSLWYRPFCLRQLLPFSALSCLPIFFKIRYFKVL